MKKREIIFTLVLIILLSMNLVLSLGNNNSNSTNTGINKALDSNVQIPEGLQTFARMFFGITNESNIDLSDFIILLGLWIGLLWVIHVAIEFVPIIKGDGIKWLMSLIVVVIISITGAIREIALWYYGVISDIEYLGEYPIVKLILSFAILIIVFFGLSRLIGMTKKEVELDEAERSGLKVGLSERRGP